MQQVGLSPGARHTGHIPTLQIGHSVFLSPHLLTLLVFEHSMFLESMGIFINLYIYLFIFLYPGKTLNVCTCNKCGTVAVWQCGSAPILRSFIVFLSTIGGNKARVVISVLPLSGKK